MGDKKMNADKHARVRRWRKITSSGTTRVSRVRPKREQRPQPPNQKMHDETRASIAREILQSSADQVRKTVETSPAPTPYKAPDKEREYLAKQAKRSASAPPVPAFELKSDYGGMRFKTDHPDPMTAQKLLMEGLGTANPVFYAGLQRRLISLMDPDDEEGVEALNFVLSTVVGAKPEDEQETMMLVEIAVMDLSFLQNAKDAFRLSRRVRVMLDDRSRPSRMKPKDPFEQENDKFVNEAAALLDTYHRAMEKIARTCAQMRLSLQRYRVSKKIADNFTESEDMSRDLPTKSGADRNRTDKAASGSEVVQLRQRVKS
jgi:hypothetical protein